MPLIAIATCEDLPDLDADERLLPEALAAAGAEVEVVVWSDPAVVWRRYDAVIIRSTWDYTDDVHAFVEWALRVGSITRLLNPAEVVAWNVNKKYLAELADAGVPIVPTMFLSPAERNATVAMPETYTEVVVKPTISAGSRNTARYVVPESLQAAAEHVDRLLDEDRVVMVQPYMDAVDTVGETGLVFIGGEFSHAIRKGQMLHRDKPGAMVDDLYVVEDISARDAAAAELELAYAALAAVPGGAEQLLYARVDVVLDEEGNPILLELELTEPSLFFQHEPEAAGRLAAAILARVS